MTTGRARLAAELRRLRDLSGMSGRDLARRIGISQSKVSRIEAGNTIPSLPEVLAWSEALDAPDEAREWLISLTSAAHTEIDPWISALQGRAHLQHDIRDREALALKVRTFQPSVVPGLLQTADYARRVFTMFQPPYSREDIAAAVAARLDRQPSMYEEGKRFDFLVTEAALRWRPGPPRLQLAQLDRIASISTLENVSIGLIPLDQEAVTVTSHGFVIYDLPADELGSFVTVEMIHANVSINDPDSIGLYETRWSLLRQMAVFDEDARKYLDELSRSIRPLIE
ncbi:MAG TPA: helix-turn-helix transcriptional regulator [Umezawaea sp.]|nr:helix-turn-helix transcriptional regulator [Umezawaea sp.]